MSETALVIMARYPQSGTTKTRLARTIGDEDTILLYRAFLTDLVERFTRHPLCDLYLAYTPAEVDYSAFVETLIPELASHIHYFPQQGDDLGERLHQAFQQMHAQGYQRTIVIGCDSPHIDSGIVAHACKALDENDVVLGPADDGGYYLLAMRQPYDVFHAIPMSTNQVLRMTIELAERQGLTIHLLEKLFDIDEWADLLRLAQLLQADKSLAPATAIQLERMKVVV
jgi:rSAM/selenodomain-associated transferase 1